MIPKTLLKKKKLSVSDLERITLASGGHNDRKQGVCAMEAAAWLAGREHTDSPICVSPSIAALMRNWNDSLKTDEDRNRLLRPLLPVILDTATDGEATEIRRGWMAIDWLARTMAPAFLDLSKKLAGHAASLRALPKITNESWAAARETVAAARAAARDTAGDAAWAAAGDAAWAAARAAARAAAWDAAWDAARAAAWDAAWDAARDAAWAAARAAAWDAARDAAWDAARANIAPVVALLQASAQDLVRRMAAVK
jgi:hypothetical protein